MPTIQKRNSIIVFNTGGEKYNCGTIHSLKNVCNNPLNPLSRGIKNNSATPTVSQKIENNKKHEQVERDNLVKKITQVNIYANNIRKTNPNSYFIKSQCDEIIKLANGALEAAKSKTITVAKNDARRVERRLNAFKPKIFIKKMEDFKIMVKSSFPSRKSFINLSDYKFVVDNKMEAIQLTYQALEKARGGDLPDAEKDAKKAEWFYQRAEIPAQRQA